MSAKAFLLALLGGLGITGSASAEVVTLADLEKRALERHVSLLASEARERAAEAGVREARSAYLPHVGFNIDSNASPGRRIRTIYGEDGKPKWSVQAVPAIVPNAGATDSQTASAFTPSWRTTGMLQISSNLYDFGRTGAAVAASRARHQAARAEHDVTRNEVVGLVRGSYLSWLSACELHRIAAEASADGTRRSERVRSLISEGARPRGDFAPVESERLLSQLELERAESDLDEARLALEYAVGEQLPDSAQPDLKLLDMQPAARSTQPDPTLRLLVFQRAVMEATAQAQRKSGMPIITFAAGAGFGVQFPDFAMLPIYQGGVNITIPIWDGGAANASAEATEARADELRLRLEDAEATRANEWAKANLEAEHALRRKATAEQLIEVCKARVHDTETGYEMGAMQFDQVQQARSMLRRAETELVMAKVAHTEALLRTAP